MSYKVKEIYYSLQGEGYYTGRESVFCRFSNCNLWSGLEKDRTKALCDFCDTDFHGTDGANGGVYEKPQELAGLIQKVWQKNAPSSSASPFVVLTGGEPLLQLDAALIEKIKALSFDIALETNGTILAPAGIDWITVSPKAGAKQRQISGNELKLVFPQKVEPRSFEHLAFQHFYLSPMEVRDKEQSLKNIQAAIAYCESNPRWKISLQYHKLVGLP